MRRRFERRVVASAVVGAFAACSAGGVLAAGFQLQEQNASGLGNAFSGQAAAAEDASTIYWNPAGMTRIKGRQAVGALHAIGPSAEFTNTASTSPATGIPLGSTGGDAGDWAFVPNAYLSWEVVADKFWAGVGINTPFGLKTEWDSDWMGRFHAIKSEVKSININPSVAWKINEMFSVGAGVSAMKFDATLTNSVAYGAIAFGLGGAGALAQAGGITREGVAEVEGDAWGWGWNIGAMINLGPATRVGLHYRSEVEQELEGDVNFGNAPTFTGPFAGLNAGFANGDIKAEVKLPDTFSVALSHNFSPRFQVLADYTWTGWSSVQDLSIFRSNGTGLTSTPLRFDDSWRIGVGANYQLTDQWKLRFGLAYDVTPVKDEFRTPRLPDSDRTWLAIGAQFAMSKQLVFDVGYAHLFADDAPSNLPSLDPAPVSGFRASPRGALVGNYEASVNIVSAGVRYSF